MTTPDDRERSRKGSEMWRGYIPWYVYGVEQPFAKMARDAFDNETTIHLGPDRPQEVQLVPEGDYLVRGTAQVVGDSEWIRIELQPVPPLTAEEFQFVGSITLPDKPATIGAITDKIATLVAERTASGPIKGADINPHVVSQGKPAPSVMVPAPEHPETLPRVNTSRLIYQDQTGTDDVCSACHMPAHAHKLGTGPHMGQRWCDNSHATVFTPTDWHAVAPLKSPLGAGHHTDVPFTRANLHGNAADGPAQQGHTKDWHAVALRLAGALRQVRDDWEDRDDGDLAKTVNDALRAEGME